MGIKCLLSLESAPPIEGPELTKLAARAPRESAQGHIQGWSDSTRMGRHLWMQGGTEELAEFEHITSRQDNTGQ